MATIDWPTTAAYKPSALKWGARTPRSGWQAFYTGQRQSVSHLADRMRVIVYLPPLGDMAASAEREAFFAEVSSAGHWLRLWHFHRTAPLGTLRGTPTVQAGALAGARTLYVQGTAGATLLGGDMLGAGGLLLQVGYAGCVADGAGVMAVPLALPLLTALSAAAAVTWFKPTGDFEVVAQDPTADYAVGSVQQGMQIELAQVLT